MGAAQTAVKAQQKAELAGKLAEAEILLSQLAEQQPAVADVFAGQEKEITESVAKIRSGSEITNVSQPAPVSKPVNYLLYIGIGVLVLLIFGKS